MSDAVADPQVRLRTISDYEKAIRAEVTRIAKLKARLENVKTTRSDTTRRMVDDFMKKLASELFGYDVSQLREELDGYSMDLDM